LDSAIIAIASSWNKLQNLYMSMAADASVSCSRLLLISLPSLESLEVKWSALPSASFTAVRFPELKCQILSNLETLRLELADDATFVGLEFPHLSYLKLSGEHVQVTDISSIISRCKHLGVLELHHCPTVTASRPVNLQKLHYLLLDNLPALSDQACGMILTGLRSKPDMPSMLTIVNCAQLTEISLATIASLRLQPDILTFKLRPPIVCTSRLEPMLSTCVNDLKVWSIHLSEMPSMVKSKFLQQFGSRLRHGSEDYVHITDNGELLHGPTN